MVEVKEALSNKRADLVQLWQRGQQVEEMTKILDQMSVYQNSLCTQLGLLVDSQRIPESHP
jgi:exocyst complex component 4